MIPLYTEEEFNNSKGQDKLKCKCEYCKNIYYRLKQHITYEIKHKKPFSRFCSDSCRTKSIFGEKVEVVCKLCGVKFLKTPSQIKKCPNNFCSRSCAVTYNNTHKTTGNRRSKLEVWLEEQLIIIYPNLEFNFNCKGAINSELDIYIPSLNLAFELNGIFHYEPIFGTDKLNQIQNNDGRKYQACIENNIELCIIDVSNFKHFKEHLAKKYLEIIVSIINIIINIK